MKIIIDIPRAKYNTLRNDSTDYRGNIGVIYRAIQNGIVLPENHGDLSSVTPKPIITNKSAVFWLENITEKYLKGDTFEDRQMKKSINKAIKALSKEPKTGHWIAEENEEMETIGYYCSECDLPMETENQTRFCPNCGAKMVVPKESEVSNADSN